MLKFWISKCFSVRCDILSVTKVKHVKGKLSRLVMQMIVQVLPSEGETSITAARMITQTRRLEQKLHIFRTTLDLIWGHLFLVRV